MLFFFLPLFQNEFNTGYYWIILKPRRQEEKFKKKYALGIGSIPAACYINTQSFKTKNETQEYVNIFNRIYRSPGCSSREIQYICVLQVSIQ